LKTLTKRLFVQVFLLCVVVVIEYAVKRKKKQ
jgi:hypothetical protein